MKPAPFTKGASTSLAAIGELSAWHQGRVETSVLRRQAAIGKTACIETLRHLWPAGFFADRRG